MDEGECFGMEEVMYVRYVTFYVSWFTAHVSCFMCFFSFSYYPVTYLNK